MADYSQPNTLKATTSEPCFGSMEPLRDVAPSQSLINLRTKTGRPVSFAPSHESQNESEDLFSENMSNWDSKSRVFSAPPPSSSLQSAPSRTPLPSPRLEPTESKDVVAIESILRGIGERGKESFGGQSQTSLPTRLFIKDPSMLGPQEANQPLLDETDSKLRVDDCKGEYCLAIGALTIYA